MLVLLMLLGGADGALFEGLCIYKLQSALSLSLCSVNKEIVLIQKVFHGMWPSQDEEKGKVSLSPSSVNKDFVLTKKECIMECMAFLI